MSLSVPITIGEGYTKYQTKLGQSVLSLEGISCPKAPACAGSVVLTGSRVLRGAVLLGQDEYGASSLRKIVALIALCCCTACGGRSRVLPCDIVAYKTFSLPAIECLLASYATWERSLRRTVLSVAGDRMPAHTTLHGWTEGVGAHVLGRLPGETSGAPFTRLLAESEKRVPAVREVDRDPDVDPARYRSEPRRERLQAMAFVLAVALVVTDLAVPRSLSEWRRLAVTWLTVSALGFASRIRCTPFEHVGGVDGQRCASPRGGSAQECRIQARSPPADSS